MPKIRTRHAQLTNEAFRDLATAAVEELYENSEPFEINDLLGWCRALKRRIGELNDHDGSAEADVMRSDEFGRAA
jgi:hypothetical protein